MAVIRIRRRGLNQHCEVVIEFLRTSMIPRRSEAAEAFFLVMEELWVVGRNLRLADRPTTLAGDELRWQRDLAWH